MEHGRPWRASGGSGLPVQHTFTRSGCYNVIYTKFKMYSTVYSIVYSQYTCSNGQVTIHILDQSYNCTTGGQEVSPCTIIDI